MITLKSATTEDIPLIQDITHEVWPSAYLHIIGQEQINYMIGLFYAPEALMQQMESGHRFYIVYHHGAPAAFASWSEMQQGIYKLHKLYVLTSMQGKGIGQFLLRAIFDELRRANGQSLRLNVNKYNKPAIAFYDKMGFQNIADEDIDIGNGFFMNDYILEYTL